MKFSIIVNKWANFYFFVQNLSEWHFSNRKEYNALWRKELGQFSPKEEQVLKKFKEIRLRYKQGKTHFERAFFIAESPWEELKKNLRAEEYIATREVFDLFEDKFRAIYEKDKVLLKQWEQNLGDKINDPIFLNSAIEIISMLYNAPPPDIEVKVYLLFSAPDRTGGGANIDERSISAEISRYSLQGINNILGIILHETIHLCFEKAHFIPLVEKKFLEDRETVYLIKEVTVAALFPKGILARKFFQSEWNMIHAKIPAHYTKPILELAGSYIDQNKPFDDEYIEKIYSVVRELKKAIK